MSIIPTISEEQAGPELKRIFNEIRGASGFLPNYFLAIGRHLPMVKAQVALTPAVLADGALTQVQKEQIGLVVSGITTSSYCVALHMEILKSFGIEKALGRKLATDYANAPVDSSMQPLFRFAEKLTRRAHDIEKADMQAVLDAGWSEAALFETVLAVGLFNFLNRVSIGLGIVADF